MRPKLITDEIYHVCNKSIVNYVIFKAAKDYKRFIQTIDYYNNINIFFSFSSALRKRRYRYNNVLIHRKESIIKILGYCIMPDHFHLLFKVVKGYPVPKYINDVENSYTRYFNVRNNRKGPLWQSAYRAVRVVSGEQLLHVLRYIHLNPTTTGLVENPVDWSYSSYRDTIENSVILGNLTEISIHNRIKYKEFVENNKSYQRNLWKIKRKMLE